MNMKQKKKAPHSDLETILPMLMGVWRRLHKESGPPDRLQTREFRRVVSAVQALRDGLEGSKSLFGKNYFSDPELLGAYLLYQWVVHYQQGLSLLNELPIIPKRVLDVCSGPAAFSFAALKHGAKQLFATDQNMQALELGAEICGRYGLPMTIRKWDCLEKPIPISGEFELIILGYCLEELFPSNQSQWNEKQNQFVLSLLDRLTPQGFLLIVDGSFGDTNKRILELRDYCVKAGVPVQAPCVWQGMCPVVQVKGSPCYAQREFEKPFLIKEIQRACSINLGSLKMSYLILKSPKSSWPQLPDRAFYRVISPPVEGFQGQRYYLCGKDGKKNLGSRLTEQTSENKAFDYLKRGELISIENPLENKHSLDIIQGTKLVVEAACGKPIPEIVPEEDEDEYS